MFLCSNIDEQEIQNFADCAVKASTIEDGVYLPLLMPKLSWGRIAGDSWMDDEPPGTRGHGV